MTTTSTLRGSSQCLRAAVLALFALASTLPSSVQAETEAAIAGGLLVALGSATICGTGYMASEDAELSDDEKKYARRGFFAGASAGFAANLFEDDLEDHLRKTFGRSVEVDTDNSFGILGQVGYRCHKRFSTEIQVEWLDSFDSDVKALGPTRKVGTHQLDTPLTFTTNMKAYLLTGRIQPFLLVGAGGMTARDQTRNKTILNGTKRSERRSEFVMRFGGGLDYYATENIILRLKTDYVLPTGELSDFDYVSIGWGAEYRF